MSIKYICIQINEHKPLSCKFYNLEQNCYSFRSRIYMGRKIDCNITWTKFLLTLCVSHRASKARRFHFLYSFNVSLKAQNVHSSHFSITITQLHIVFWQFHLHPRRDRNTVLMQNSTASSPPLCTEVQDALTHDMNQTIHIYVKHWPDHEEAREDIKYAPVALFLLPPTSS